MSLLKDDAINKADPKVRYFGPGIHKAGKLVVKSGETVYIDSGAVVHGAIVAEEAENIKILGRGILDTSIFERGDANGSISLYKCTDVEIKGIIIRDPNTWTVIPAACKNVLISNIKLIGLWRYNADGIDVVNSQHVRIEKCFVRSFDDCIVIKGLQYRCEYYTDDLNVEDVVVDDCVIWCDWGRALEIGAETCADEMRDITFKNCHIIRTTHIAMDIQHGDRAAIRDVRFENIFVEIDDRNQMPVLQESKDEKYENEEEYCPQLIYIGIEKSIWSHDSRLGCVENVYFKDIRVNGKHFPGSRIFGHDEEHNVKNVTLENVYINGRMVGNAEEGKLVIGDFAYNIELQY